MGLLRGHLNVVLHQVRLPENLGAVARLMANFGIDRLYLSDAHLWSLEEEDHAERVAVRAAGVLQSVRRVPTLEEALSDSVFVVGTTGRSQIRNRRVLTPEQAATRLAEESTRGRITLLFGGEQRGLSDAELERCDEIAFIPTSLVQPSMNLAQSAAVFLYLCAREDEGRPEAMPEVGPGANLKLLYALEEKMKDVLLRAQFLNPEAPEHILRELGRTLVRAHLTQREAELWMNAFTHLDRKLGE